MLTPWKSRLEKEVMDAVTYATAGVPEDYAAAMTKCVSHIDHQELSLLAVASAMWCGGSPETGLPVAAAALMMRSGISVHLTLEDFRGRVLGYPSPLQDTSAATAILCGDGLIALAMQHLAENCGRHSAELVEAAADALGSGGVLAGLSLDIGPEDAGTSLPDGRKAWEVTSGRISQFAARGGALLAGASDTMLDDASMIGLLIGRASFLARGGRTPSMEGIRGKMSLEAGLLIQQAEAIAGHGPEAALFSSIMYFADLSGA